MAISKSWIFCTFFSLIVHAVLLAVNHGFWVEADSITFADLAKTQSLSYCTPIGYPVFLFIFGLGAKFLWIPVVVQIVLRSYITGLILAYLAEKYHLTLKKTFLLWIIFHTEPQQLYYNACLMAESLLVSVLMAQWYVWQRYQDTKNKRYMWLLYLCIVSGLYLKPVAIVSVILLSGYSLFALKKHFKILTGTILTYIIFYISVSSVYYWRYSSFEPDLFKGILFWNNASVLTPMLKETHFQTNDPEINLVLEAMYARKDAEYAFEQDDNRIFEDSSFTQKFIENEIKQGKTYREAVVHTNTLFEKVAKQIVWHYPVSFVKAYILPNTKEWLKALFLPHSVTYLVPSHLAQLHTHAKIYSPYYFADNIHSIFKLVFLTVALVGTLVLIYRKQKRTLYLTVSVWFFVAIYIILNILLHPLEYRYIYPVIAGMQFITVILVADYLRNSDSYKSNTYYPA